MSSSESSVPNLTPPEIQAALRRERLRRYVLWPSYLATGALAAVGILLPIAEIPNTNDHPPRVLSLSAFGVGLVCLAACVISYRRLARSEDETDVLKGRLTQLAAGGAPSAEAAPSEPLSTAGPSESSAAPPSPALEAGPPPDMTDSPTQPQVPDA